MSRPPSNFGKSAAEPKEATPSDRERLLVLGCHPGWMSLKFLAAATGESSAVLEAWLAQAEKRGWLEAQEREEKFWHLKNSALASALLAQTGEEKVRATHRRLYEYVAALPPSENYAGMLAFHAAAGGLAVPAFSWNLRWGELLSGDAEHEQALATFRRALPFADTDFKRACAWDAVASESTLLGRFEEAAGAWQEAIAAAKAVPWDELVFSYSLSLGNLYSHLARFHDAEIYFRQALEKIPAERSGSEWVGVVQNLGVALIEQGKYRQALEEFLKCRRALDASGDSVEKSIAAMHLARIYNALGMGTESTQELEAAGGLLQDPSLASLKPYFEFLQGRFELTQGRFAPAFRTFEEAALAYERAGDLAGKVEVLLSVSAVLLEHSLIKEAQSLISQLADWEGLVKFPALQHAIRLRRLALGAFSGKWVQDDINLLLQDSQEVGRVEDWLQFWFHLSLAARRIRQPELITTFLNLAEGVAERIARDLTPGQRETFFKRPDIARLKRLTSAPAVSHAAPAVRARRTLPSTGPAEAATLATPVKGKEEK
jgi:tetratricopeptide (TPR) repeat protein